jgi:hypothetical protein
VSAERLCCELSEEVGEQLAATATHAERWLLVEVPGTWPRDVSEGAGLSETATTALQAWLQRTPSSRVLYIRRPGRAPATRLVFAVEATEEARNVRRIEVTTLDELADLDLSSAGTTSDVPLVLVCAHGTRDRCCARRGAAVHGALARRLGAEQLWLSSHQGGHRFAANVLVLPAGLQFGRVGSDDAPRVVERALDGRITLDRYRGRTSYPPLVQAAECALREAERLDGTGDVRVLELEGRRVRLSSADGRVHLAEVEEVHGPAVPASCGAEAEPQRAFAARLR